ncbi:CHAD domain-containing protein [Streptomyces sp. SCSIO 30461]|uniref:CHAD domain-containing protein n=1 Tax=Streptomyces sp. SCSIO 30461 TaxID=3118085 RepID=UPI0030CBE7FF
MHSPDLPLVPRGTGADQVLAGYLHAQAGGFLRSLRSHRESGADAEGAEQAARALRRTSRRICGALHTYRALVEPAWADQLRTELAWLSGMLAQEHACTSRLARLLDALSRLSGATGPGAGGVPHPTRAEQDPSGAGAAGTGAQGAEARAAEAQGVAGHGVGAHRGGTGARGALTVGAARAGALLERQLTLSRTRAHSAALQALGSSRFHAVADAVALLASEVPLSGAAAAPAETLDPHADATERKLLDAVAILPLTRAAHPYNAEALVHGLAKVPAEEVQDAPWHQVRVLLRLHRYAQEVRALVPASGADPLLTVAARALDRHRDAAEAAAAAAAAARTPRIAPATAYALGVLHADQRHEVEAARFTFHQVWQEVSHGPADSRGSRTVTAP